MGDHWLAWNCLLVLLLSKQYMQQSCVEIENFSLFISIVLLHLKCHIAKLLLRAGLTRISQTSKIIIYIQSVCEPLTEVGGTMLQMQHHD